jgi:hypothetical protein
MKINNNFKNGKFGDEKGNIFSVNKVINFVSKNKEKYFIPEFDLKKIENKLEWWEENYLVNDLDLLMANLDRMLNCDTKFPILILVENDGNLSVADGLNRLFKAICIEKKKYLPAYLVPKSDIIHLNIRKIPKKGKEKINLVFYLAKSLIKAEIQPNELDNDCLYWAFKQMGLFPSNEDIINYYELTKVEMLKGLNESKYRYFNNEKTIALVFDNFYEVKNSFLLR